MPARQRTPNKRPGTNGGCRGAPHRSSGRGLFQIRRDSRATAAGRAAMLDDGRANISRRTDRREGDEERVVALLPRDLPNLTGAARALVVANAVDLRSA